MGMFERGKPKISFGVNRNGQLLYVTSYWPRAEGGSLGRRGEAFGKRGESRRARNRACTPLQVPHDATISLAPRPQAEVLTLSLGKTPISALTLLV